MLHSVKKAFNNFKQKVEFHRLKRFINWRDDSIRSGVSVEIRRPKEGHIYMEVGSKSVISGRFIFETEKGHIKIGDRTYIGGGLFISKEDIEIGDDVIIAWGALVYDHNSHSILWEERKDDVSRVYENLITNKNPLDDKNWDVVKAKPICICNKAWIGANCTILKGVTIGEGAVVGAGSVVTKDVNPWTVVAGNPAKLVRTLEH